ncbi:MAG: diguanylate cyclase [Anaerolineales bacterium]|nr:diguanylate cyclase [Anaerolineales bacterium]
MPNRLLINRFVNFSKSASLMVILIGLLVMIGWIFDIQELKSVFHGLRTMKFNTTLVAILIGMSLWLSLQENKKYSFIIQISGIIVLLIGLLTLSQYLFKLNFGIDQLLFTDLQTTRDSFPGRMSFASALCSTLIGLALIFLNSEKEKIRVISQYPSVIVLAISFLALVGYLYDVQALYTLDFYSSMGLYTATVFTLSSSGILLSKPDEGWIKLIASESAGGAVLRRLLLPMLGVPLVLGWFVLFGERAGLYDTHFGLAIISVLIASFLIIILFTNSRQINFVDTKRKAAEERYRNALDNMMEGTQIIGYDWRYLYVNETVARQGRQAKENLLGRTMMEVYPGIEKTELFNTLKKHMQERTSHSMENEFIYSDGTKGWFELSIQPVEEGLFILSNDITKRKYAEERFHLAVESAPYGIILSSSTGEITLVNSQVEKIFQYSRDELIGRSVEELVPEGFRQKHFTYHREFFQNPRTRPMGVGRDLYARRKDGSEFPVEIGLVPIETHHEKIVMATILDITQRKQTEAELLRLNKELELRIFERTAHLNLTNEKLQNELLHRQQAEEQIIHQNKMLSELHEITLDLLKQNNLEQLLRRIVEISSEFLDATYGGITLIEGEELVLKAVTQNRAGALGQRYSRDDAKLTWQAFDSKKTMVLSNYDSWPDRRKQSQGFPRHAVIDIPILNGDECLGVLALGREKPNYEFSEEQIQFGGLFASLTALIITNSQLRETLKQQSIHDSLTGLFNRRYMEETLIQEISRAVRNGHSLGIIMLDIDHFKNFNDTHGHVNGDSLLSELGKFLKTNIRTEDTACRYGGEEFLLIMPDVSLETVLRRAELLRQGVSELQIQADTFANVTISLGIAMYPQHGTTMEFLIRSADKALYQAKQNGRNRVEVAA